MQPVPVAFVGVERIYSTITRRFTDQDLIIEQPLPTPLVYSH